MSRQPLPPYPHAKSRDRNRRELASIGAKFVRNESDPLTLMVEYQGKRYEFESHKAVSDFVKEVRKSK